MYGNIMQQNLQFYFYCGLIFLGLSFIGCANQVSPTGGPKDDTPPKVVKEESTPNMQTNFDKRSFELAFDEYVKLEDAFNQVVVSPPLEHKTKISLQKGKTVQFEFDEKEVLREGATYIINFGNAVKDLNAGNIAKNLRFVFSTGDFIDSLSVSGKVIDALTGDPAEDVLFMLYDNLADSVVQKELPFYFAKTDKDGTFKINNVKSDTFKVFALKDNNLNYKFDMDGEMIGFSDEYIIVTDSTKNNVRLSIFEEARPLRLMTKVLDNYGHVKLVFNQKYPAVDVSVQDIGQKYFLDYEKDTIHIWYDLVDSLDWKIYLKSDSTLVDTLKVSALSKKKFLEESKLSLAVDVVQKANSQNPLAPLELKFKHPLAKLDTSAILLLEDTLLIRVKPKLTIDTLNKKLSYIDYPWNKKLVYSLHLLPGAFTDYFGLQNDSILITPKIAADPQVGNITLTIKGMKADTNYVVLLLDEKKEVFSNSFQSDSIYQHTYEKLPPGSYSVRVIEDVNGNKRWDPGNYTLKKQSERWFFGTIEELKIGWDVEGEINVDQK